MINKVLNWIARKSPIYKDIQDVIVVTDAERCKILKALGLWPSNNGGDIHNDSIDIGGVIITWEERVFNRKAFWWKVEKQLLLNKQDNGSGKV